MSTTITPQERLRQVVAKGQELAAKGVRSADESKEMATLLQEAHDLQDQIKQNEAFAEVNDYAGRSAGMLPLAGAPGEGNLGNGAYLDGFTPAGEMLIENTRAGLRIADEYGEGVMNIKGYRASTTKKYREAFRSYLRTPGGVPVDPTAFRTLQEGVDSSGGFLVPSDILDRIIAKMPTPTRVAARVTQLQTGRDNVVIPRLNYTSASDDSNGTLYTTGMRVTWTGENPSSATAARVTDPAWGQTQIPVWTAMMSIPITNDMIEDASFPLVSFVSDKFAETVDLVKDYVTLSGSGQGQPSGILLNPGGTNQPGTVTTASQGVIAADDVLSIAYSLPEQYEDNAAWVMNKTSTLQAIAKLKDGANHYLFSEGLTDNGFQSPAYMRRTLLGMPVVLSGFMPNVGNGSNSIIFGDLRGYYLVNRVGFSIQVLRELYAETNQIVLLGRLRLGGQVVEPWRMTVGVVHS